ncbi:MAG: NlpC/P60 family protein [Thermomicrobiales bacterium]
MGHEKGCRRRFTRGYAWDIHQTRHFRRFVLRGGAGSLFFMMVLFTACDVAAGPPATGQPSPTATATAGAAGQLSSGPSPSASPAPSPTSVATPSSAAILMPLQPPTAEMPPATTTAGATSPTMRAPTASPTATLPLNTPTASATATGTPTGTPGVTPSPEESAALANLVLLDDPGIGGNLTIVRAAARHFGEQLRPDGVPWAGWCEMYIGDVMDEAGIARPRYATALLDATSAPLYRGHAPAGSVIYFDQRANPSGHVGIALGDGTMLSALDNGIVRSAYENWPSYLGWRPYGTTAPPGETFMIAPLLTPTESDFPRMPAWP